MMKIFWILLVVKHVAKPATQKTRNKNSIVPLFLLENLYDCLNCIKEIAVYEPFFFFFLPTSSLMGEFF